MIMKIKPVIKYLISDDLNRILLGKFTLKTRNNLWFILCYNMMHYPIKKVVQEDLKIKYNENRGKK